MNKSLLDDELPDEELAPGEHPDFEDDLLFTTSDSFQLVPKQKMVHHKMSLYCPLFFLSHFFIKGREKMRKGATIVVYV